jgi:hypothetical protein
MEGNPTNDDITRGKRPSLAGISDFYSSLGRQIKEHAQPLSGLFWGLKLQHTVGGMQWLRWGRAGKNPFDAKI